MQARDAFKVGFLSRCVEDGLSLEEAHERVKVAMDKLAGLTDLPGKIVDLAKPVLSTGLAYGIPAAIAAPPILGGLAGYGASKLTDVDDTDVDEIKKQEVIDEYKRQIAKLDRDKRIRAFRDRRQQTGRVFM